MKVLNCITVEKKVWIESIVFILGIKNTASMMPDSPSQIESFYVSNCPTRETTLSIKKR